LGSQTGANTTYSSQLATPDFPESMPTYSVLGDVLATTGMFKFRVARLSGGGFGVFADHFPVENYSSEEEAKALCNRLIHQQARDHKRGD
jgi:hypothetical protein